MGDEPEGQEPTPEVDDDKFREVLEAKGVDPEDFEQYREDRDNWSKNQNRHNQRAAEAATEAEKRLEKVDERINRLLSGVESGNGQPQQQAQMDPGKYRSQFYQRLGRDPDSDSDDPVTMEDLYRVGYGFNEFARTNLAGAAAQMTEIMERVEKTQSTVSEMETMFGEVLVDQEIESLKGKYPHADEDHLRHVIASTDATGDAFDAELEEAARKSHEKIRKTARSISEEERERRKKSKQVTSMAGRGSAVAGEKPPNVWSDEGKKEFFKQAAMRRAAEQEEV